MGKKLKISLLNQDELLTINGGSDCPMDSNETAHSLGEFVGGLFGLLVGSALILVKKAGEKILS